MSSIEDHSAFLILIDRLRRGDAAAAEEIVRRYEPLVRREIRLRIVDSRLSRVYDSIDFVQEVLASFLLRVRHSEFELHEERDLVRLLTAMAKNKVVSGSRRILSDKRDGKRVDPSEFLMAASVAREETPSKIIELRELIESAHDRLSEDERQIAAFRRENLSWDEIGKRMNSTASACRIKLSRALHRISIELGLET